MDNSYEKLSFNYLKSSSIDEIKIEPLLRNELKTSNLIKKEENYKGSVSLKTWWKYLFTSGLFLLLIFIVIELLGDSIKVAGDYWVKKKKRFFLLLNTFFIKKK